MHPSDSKNNRIARLIAPALFGILFSLLAFTGPFAASSGAVFDALLARRPAPVPTRDILLLEADSAALEEAGNLPWNREILAEGLALLTEMEAGSVVFDATVENEIFRERGARDELRAAFEKEFSLLKSNVRTLFDAIRLGSVRPKDSIAFVEEILTLADGSKARLMDAAGNRERDRELRFEKAERAFGKVYHAETPLEPDTQLVRRTFARYGLSESQDPLGYALFDAVRDRIGEPDFEIPLDENGAVLADPPRGVPGSDFRRLSYELLLRHARLEKELYRELKSMERAGYVVDIGSDLSPASIYDYAQETGIEKTGEWRGLRERFFDSAGRFLEGPSEGRILAGYDVLLASPTLTEEGSASIQALKSAASNSFGRARGMLRELRELRKTLKDELVGSICVVAPALRSPVSRVKAATALADAFLSKRFLRVFPRTMLFAVCASLAFALSTILAFLGPIGAVVVGTAVSVIAAAGAAATFVLLGAWFNPLLAAGAAGTATLVSSFIALTERGERKRALLRSFAPRMSPESLKKVASAHYARLVEGEKREASIVAVRAKGIAEYADAADSKATVAAFRLYHETIGDVLKKEGAFLYAIEGELIFASFGAPVPRADHRAAAAAAALAVVAAEETLGDAFQRAGFPLPRGSLRVGVDAGLCDFGEAGLSGFSVFAAFGPVPVRARVLSNLAERYGCRALATEEVKRGLDDAFQTLRLDQLVTKADGKEEYFYEVMRNSMDDPAME